MTQLNENLKLADAIIFFPRSRSVFLKYGICAPEIEAISIKEACEKCGVNVNYLLDEILRHEEERLARQTHGRPH